MAAFRGAYDICDECTRLGLGSLGHKLSKADAALTSRLRKQANASTKSHMGSYSRSTRKNKEWRGKSVIRIEWSNHAVETMTPLIVAQRSYKALQNKTSESNCSLCSFLLSMTRENVLEHHDVVGLYACPSVRLNCAIDLDHLVAARVVDADTALLALIPHNDSNEPDSALWGWHTEGVLRVYRSPVSDEVPEKGIWGRRMPEKTDFKIPREWLGFCRLRHQKACGRPKANERLEGFRLINCNLSVPAVEEHDLDEDYVALSYVWESSPETPGGMTKLVLDAIAATKQLGFNYLWVDRLCIDQGNPHEKIHVISNMNRIYQQAEVTLVAAADHCDGLVGVGVTKVFRKSQIHTYLGDLELVSLCEEPIEAIKRSKWYSRAWTFQESLLSRRLLIFTPDQLYWNCCSMDARETIQIGSQICYTPDKSKMAPWMLPGLFDRLYRGGMHGDAQLDITDFLLRELNEVARDINGFTRRSLTYDSDSLLAFKGIIQMYLSQGSGKLQFILGLPVLQDVIRDRSAAFALALCDWGHDEIIPMLGNPCRRRPHLPSWTWAGWKGTVSDSSLDTAKYVVERSRQGARIDTAVYGADLSFCVGGIDSGVELAVDQELPAAEDDEWNCVLVLKNPHVASSVGIQSIRDNMVRIGDVSFFLRLSVTCIEPPGTEGRFHQQVVNELRTDKAKAVLCWCDKQNLATASLLVARRCTLVKESNGHLLWSWERIGTLRPVGNGLNIPFEEFLESTGLSREGYDMFLA
jgi:hypothetical protein